MLARFRSRIACLTLFAAVFVVVSGWWFALNVHWYGDPLAISASEKNLERLAPGLLADGFSSHRTFVETPRAIWNQFVYSSGWNSFMWPNWWYLPFWLAIGVGLVGLTISIPRAWRRQVAVLAAVAALAMFSVFVITIRSMAPNARVAFTGLPAIAVLVALGYERLRLPRLARFALPVMGVVGVLVALQRDVLRHYGL